MARMFRSISLVVIGERGLPRLEEGLLSPRSPSLHLVLLPDERLKVDLSAFDGYSELVFLGQTEFLPLFLGDQDPALSVQPYRLHAHDDDTAPGISNRWVSTSGIQSFPPVFGGSARWPTEGPTDALMHSPTSKIPQEGEAGDEEVLASAEPDEAPEVEEAPPEEPPRASPLPRPPLYRLPMLPAQRVVPRVQPRDDPELGEVRVVDPRPLDELELPRDVALEGLEQEADLAGGGSTGPVGDPPPHDPPPPLLRNPEGAVRPALVRLPDVRMERAPVPGRIVGQVREVVDGASTVVRLERHGSPVLEPPDDERAREGLRHAEPGCEGGHSGVESHDILAQLPKDGVGASLRC